MYSLPRFIYSDYFSRHLFFSAQHRFYLPSLFRTINYQITTDLTLNFNAQNDRTFKFLLLNLYFHYYILSVLFLFREIK